MFGEVSAALSSVRAMTDIVKGMTSLKHEAELNAKTAALTGAILEVQQQLLKTGEEMEGLYKKIRELEAKVAENNKLDAYERVRLPRTNVIVYGLKTIGAAVAGERAPGHYACPVCIEKDKTVITLQEEKGDYYLRCNCCKTVFQHTPQPDIDHDGGEFY